jgi:hypothetical protein
MKRRDLMTLVAGAAAWPMLARGQDRRRAPRIGVPRIGVPRIGVPRIGVLWHAGDIEGGTPSFGSLLGGFEALGYTRGKIGLIHRFPDEKPEQFQKMAAGLVALSPDVLVGGGGRAALPLRDLRQHENRKDARAHHTADPARAGRRRHRVKP